MSRDKKNPEYLIDRINIPMTPWFGVKFQFSTMVRTYDELTFDEENAEPMSPLRLPSVGYGSTKDLSGKSASMRRSTHSHFSRSAHVRASLKD